MKQSQINAIEEYSGARKKGRQQYFASIAQGRSGFIPSLDGVLQNATIASEINIGTHTIPLKKIIGTMSHSRALMFAENFMPLAKAGSEFMEKWCALYKTHMEEGIRDPVKLYDYLNWFYVIEGNKRVSLLKYMDAYSINAKIVRLLPKKNPEDRVIESYYDFIEFNRITGIFNIWIRKPGGFLTILKHLEKYDPDTGAFPDKYRLFYSRVFTPFREIYLQEGGKELSCSTGDAFIDFIEIYGLPAEISFEDHGNIIRGLIVEIKSGESTDSVTVEADPGQKEHDGIVSSIAEIITPAKKLKVAFIHTGDAHSSGWTQAHEQGRIEVQEKLTARIITESIFHADDETSASRLITGAAKEYDVVFTTSPPLLQATLQVALQYPQVRFFNCNRKWSYKHVRTYFGRSYEVRYLLGILAGALTKTNKIGFIATTEIPETRASVNAFGLGAASVNPYARILLEWTGRWDDPDKARECAYSLCSRRADIISQNVLLPPNDTSEMYGLYGIRETNVCDDYSVIHYAKAVWNWGVFYKRILKNVLSNTLKTARNWTDKKSTPINFWWGIDSRILDIEYSRTNIPAPVLNMAENIKKMIILKELNPFQGPIVDQDGRIRFKDNESAAYEDMLHQTWLVDNIERSRP